MQSQSNGFSFHILQLSQQKTTPSNWCVYPNFHFDGFLSIGKTSALHMHERSNKPLDLTCGCWNRSKLSLVSKLMTRSNVWIQLCLILKMYLQENTYLLWKYRVKCLNLPEIFFCVSFILQTCQFTDCAQMFWIQLFFVNYFCHVFITQYWGTSILLVNWV